MKSHLKLILAAAAVALFVPAMALATPNEHSQGHANGGATGNTGPTGPEYAPAPQGNAYGVICRGKSKEHHEGEKGTEFSRCVTALAHAHNHPNQAPGQVCKGKSKKHVKGGEKGTEFSRCVHDVVKLRHQEHEEQQQGS
jgi:hypothetical protein